MEDSSSLRVERSAHIKTNVYGIVIREHGSPTKRMDVYFQFGFLYSVTVINSMSTPPPTLSTTQKGASTFEIDLKCPEGRLLSEHFTAAGGLFNVETFETKLIEKASFSR
jgi:hypothetical protein